MKQHWSRVAIALALWGCARKGPVAAGAGSTSPSLVYAIERDGAVSHLMGTCHLPLSLEDRVDPTLIDQARVVWLEVPMDELDPMSSLAQIWSEDRSVSTEVDRRTFTALTRKSPAVPASMVEHIEPWATAVTLGVNQMFSPDQMQAMFGGEQTTLDGRVDARAQAAGVPRRSLETIDEQLALLASDDVDLESIVFPSEADRRASRKETQAVLDLCYGQDLEHLAPASYADTPANRLLLLDRNERWLAPLVPELTQGGAFVAVGSMHLAGRKGLLKLLQARGFTVERLPARVPPAQPPPLPTNETPEPVLIDEATRNTYASGIASALCAPEQIAMGCFHTDADACVAELTHDVALCMDQHFEDVPTFQKSAGTTPAFTACVLSGMVGRGLATSFPDREACVPLQEATRKPPSADGSGSPTRQDP